MRAFRVLPLVSASLLAGYMATGADVAESPAFGADTGSPPIGVEAANWIPVSEKLGFVVVSNVGDSDRTFAQPSRSEPGQPTETGPFTTRVRSATPPVSAAGYFMVKTRNGWRRLVVMTPAELAAAAGG